MDFTFKEICELTNQSAEVVVDICGTDADICGSDALPGGRFTILSYYYVYLISSLMNWCTIDALKKSIPFEWLAPMVERAHKEENELHPSVPDPTKWRGNPCPPAGMVYANWTPTVMGTTSHTKVVVEIYWEKLIRDARETLLEWLLAQRAKEKRGEEE
jgi:hypothetical protein